MPQEISGLRIARSFISPTNVEVQRTLDFQLGVRQGISIEGILGEIAVDESNFTLSSSTVTGFSGTHTLHLETGSLETVPDAAGEDEDTIDSEIFYRQRLTILGNDDAATEFRSSVDVSISPSGMWVPPRPLFTARNITHRGITLQSNLDILCHVTIYYVFVEFSLSELGLILARRG